MVGFLKPRFSLTVTLHEQEWIDVSLYKHKASIVEGKSDAKKLGRDFLFFSFGSSPFPYTLFKVNLICSNWLHLLASCAFYWAILKKECGHLCIMFAHLNRDPPLMLVFPGSTLPIPWRQAYRWQAARWF
jgi:hypothetical protein